MSELTHFDLQSLHIDPETNYISTSRPSRALNTELAHLNDIHHALLIQDPPVASFIPPPPIPVNPKRTAHVSKLRDIGNSEYRKQKYSDAVGTYSLGYQVALTRPLWEPAALVREEVSALLANRAQAHMAMQAWPEGAVDAEASVEARRVGNAKGWWRRGRCLVEMGRLEEAREWVKKGLEVEGEEGELVTLLKDIDAAIERKKGAALLL